MWTTSATVQIESGERVVVGVNEFVDDDRSSGGVEIFRLDPNVLERQLDRLARVKREREERRVAAALRAIETAAPDVQTNLMPHIEEAVRARHRRRNL
jgi:methylmalonyl-CoA mutase, N-terminal domain